MGKKYRPLLEDITPLDIAVYLNAVLKTLSLNCHNEWCVIEDDDETFLSLVIRFEKNEQSKFETAFNPLIEGYADFTHYEMRGNTVKSVGIKINAFFFKRLQQRINGDDSDEKPVSPPPQLSAPHPSPALPLSGPPLESVIHAIAAVQAIVTAVEAKAHEADNANNDDESDNESDDDTITAALS